MENLEKQKRFFDDNRTKILSEYKGKAIVISGALEIHAFASLEEGYKFGVEHYGYGNFLLKDCSQDPQQVHIVTPIITVVSL